MQEPTKHPAQSKTIWFGIALLALDLVPQVQEFLVQHFPAEMAEYGVAIIGVIVIVLRLVTGQPLRRVR